MSLYNVSHKPSKDMIKYSVTLNVPRYLQVEVDRNVIVYNDQFDFYDDSLYKKGRYKITLKLHGESVYLEKEEV